MTVRRQLVTCPKCLHQYKLDVPVGLGGCAVFIEAKIANELDVLRFRLALDLLAEPCPDLDEVRYLLRCAHDSLTAEGDAV